MPAERIAGIVEQTNALQPDCILLLGDYVAGHKHRAASPSRSPMRTGPARWPGCGRRSACTPCSAITTGGTTVRCSARGTGPATAGARCEDAGIPVYENDVPCGSTRTASRSGSPASATSGPSTEPQSCERRAAVTIEGVDDLAGTLAQVTDDAPVILMAHEPDIFPRVPDRVALTLSGHTHGGQVRLLGYSPMVPSRYGKRYAYGHIVEDGRNLIVSGGLGCSVLPVRFGSPPEIVDDRARAAPEAGA